MTTSNAIFTLCMIAAPVLAHYALWCFLRSRLLKIALDAHYRRFCNALQETVDEDTLLASDEFRSALDKRLECWLHARSLNAFSVARCSVLSLRKGVDAHLDPYVPTSEQEAIGEALTLLRSEKCKTIEFYIKYCRLSGYVWIIRRAVLELCGRPNVPAIEEVLPRLLATLLGENSPHNYPLHRSGEPV